ncbi:hypothetical protein [Bacillus thuringiensis]|uniref:hypothetical protein n=1 Tax=Bacillus thuringiensis TaxID=1428 RepID=UPI000BFCE14B|nr:hypothetical protein [Bacillus thuringiensis]PGM17219.1 hypothetical protein CN938_04665 [Bacillus thuringiensis]
MDDTTISLLSLGVSALGVFVTGIFSCLIWQANKLAAKAASDAAAAAQDSAKLAEFALENQKVREEHLKAVVREEIKNKILVLVVNILRISSKNNTSEHVNALPNNLQLQGNWQIYFSKKECAAIKEAELVLQTYTKKYVQNSNPNIHLTPDFLDDTANLTEVFEEVSHLLMETVIGKKISDLLGDK